MKWIGTLCFVILLALGAAFAFRNVVLKRALEEVLAAQTGFGLEVERVNLGWSLTSFEVEGARLLNPADFPDREALTIRQARVEVEPLSLLTREIRIREVILDVGKLVLVRKPDGESNADRLGGKRKESGGGGGTAPRKEGGPGPRPGTGAETKAGEEPRRFRIERLVLKIGTVEMRDYTKAGQDAQPAVTAMTLNVEQEHRDVTSLPQLGSLVLGGAIQQAGFALIGQELQDPDSKLNKKIQKAANRLQKNLDRLFGAPQE